MRTRLPLLAAFLVVVSGCVAVDSPVTPSGVAGALTPVRDRASLPYAVDGEFSQVLAKGPFGVLDALSIDVPYEVPAGNGVGEPTVHMGVFLPDMPGCDLDAETVPEECRVPVIADIGPYYGDGDVRATEPAQRLGGFLIENFVPHGYAVAQVSVPGTGDSVGCMDLMGEIEQAGVQAAVEALGTAAWSNGAVGLIGRSYDGSTPFEAAMVPSPYLKTIVPISGLYGQRALMYPNGSAEDRGPGLLWGLYYSDSFQGNEDRPDLQAMQAVAAASCPESTGGGLYHAAEWLQPGNPVGEAYWAERDFKDEVLASYEGSVYFIHGLRDWNVDPHMAFPFYNELEAKGLDMKGLFGQWQHMYPDRPGEHEACGECPTQSSVRWDWAQDLLEWFDHYLKGTGPKPELHVEIQDDLGGWRIEPTWPPADLAWRDVALDSMETMGPAVILPGTGVGEGFADELAVAVGAPAPPKTSLVVLTLPAEETTLRLTGLVQLHMTVTPSAAGGQIFAALYDAEDGRRLAHGILNLGYPLAPGQPIEAHLQMEPADAVLPAGHALELRLGNVGLDYLPPSVNGAVQVDLAASTLRLPLVERTGEDFFLPPGADASAEER